MSRLYLNRSSHQLDSNSAPWFLTTSKRMVKLLVRMSSLEVLMMQDSSKRTGNHPRIHTRSQTYYDKIPDNQNFEGPEPKDVKKHRNIPGCCCPPCRRCRWRWRDPRWPSPGTGSGAPKRTLRTCGSTGWPPSRCRGTGGCSRTRTGT